MACEFSGTRILLCVAVVSGAACASPPALSAPHALESESGGVPRSSSLGHDIDASFACAGGKKIHVMFITAGHASVLLDLPDGRQLQLPQAPSASGARYASPDESIVFWNKGRSAFLEEHGQRTYSGCVQSM